MMTQIILPVRHLDCSVNAVAAEDDLSVMLVYT